MTKAFGLPINSANRTHTFIHQNAWCVHHDVTSKIAKLPADSASVIVILFLDREMLGGLFALLMERI